MHQISRIDLRDRKEAALRLRDQVQDFADAIRQSGRVAVVILFGSLARGDFHEGSDIDLILIGDFPERFHLRSLAFRELTDLPIEPICYTQDEFKALILEENSFIQTVLREGIRL
ncbi:hypothetical protein RJ53_07990 [Methanocalculus chunghsingensis]|uniref:Polymerase nucleotidyl transferase domain-containing protein n=1 Tax=Methanocalculus chunghsingensis TaxID=156457 RepID=A0A8J7W6V0_9EURY|nr:nucleotidyltransferase domain-containing protein [Methanocalculus chunghsingensis]MBR1369436.1 hypothetical protein [Methanocalculus chunghsingensis]